MTYSQRIFIQPATGKQCIRITYDTKNDQGWAGIYWTDWKNPWGDNPNGYDLSKYKKLHFIARGEKGGETIDFIKVGGISGRYPDSGSCDLGGLLLTKKWHKYSFDLDGDLSFINGGFMICFTSDGKSGIQIVYVDEIYFE